MTCVRIDGVEFVAAFRLVFVLKRPRISLTVVRCEGGGEEVPGGAGDEPKISARIS